MKRNLMLRICGGAVLLIGLLAVVGYASGNEMLYHKTGTNAAMALPTAILFVVLGTGYVLLGKQENVGKEMPLGMTTILSSLFLVVLAILIFTEAYLIYNESQRQLSDTVYNQLITAVQVKASELRMFLANEKVNAAGMAPAVIFKDLLGNTSPANYDANLIKTQKRLEDTLRSNPNIYGAAVLNSQDVVVASTDLDEIGRNESGASYVLAAENSTNLDDTIIRENGRNTIHIASPIVDYGGARIGTYVDKLDIMILEKLIGQNNNLGKTSEFFLIDEEGYRLTSSKYVNNSILTLVDDATNSKACLEHLAAFRQGDASAALTDAQYVAFSDNLKIYRDYRGINVLGTHTPLIPEARWCLIAKVDETEALGVYRGKILNDIAYYFIFLLLAGLVLSWLTASVITRPIKNLTNKVTEISRGNLESRLDYSNIQEVQELTEALNRVMASMKLAVLRTGLSIDKFGLGEALAARQEAERKYHAIYQNSADAIMTLDPTDGRFTAANPATLRIFGFDAEAQFTKTTPGELSPAYQPDGESSPKKAMRMITKAMTEGSTYFEWTHKRQSGEEFPATVWLTKIKAGDKELVQAIVKDISENKKLAKEREESENFLRSIVQNIPNMIFVKEGKELRFKLFNKAGEELLGKTADTILGRNDYDLFPKKEAEFFIEKDREVLKGKKLLDIPEEQIRAKDGTHFLHTKKIPLLDTEGKPQYLLGISEDITERKKEREGLELFKRGFDTMNEGTVIFVKYEDKKPTIQYVNKVFTRIYGYELPEVYGKNPNILGSGKQNRVFYKKMWADVLDPRKGYWEGDLINRGKAGELIPVHLAIHTLWSNGKAEYFMAQHTKLKSDK
jgi:PAS domain S-box-containing protein